MKYLLNITTPNGYEDFLNVLLTHGEINKLNLTSVNLLIEAIDDFEAGRAVEVIDAELNAGFEYDGILEIKLVTRDVQSDK